MTKRKNLKEPVSPVAPGLAFETDLEAEAKAAEELAEAERIKEEQEAAEYEARRAELATKVTMKVTADRSRGAHGTWLLSAELEGRVDLAKVPVSPTDKQQITAKTKELSERLVRRVLTAEWGKTHPLPKGKHEHA